MRMATNRRRRVSSPSGTSSMVTANMGPPLCEEEDAIGGGSAPTEDLARLAAIDVAALHQEFGDFEKGVAVPAHDVERTALEAPEVALHGATDSAVPPNRLQRVFVAREVG